MLVLVLDVTTTLARNFTQPTEFHRHPAESSPQFAPVCISNRNSSPDSAGCLDSITSTSTVSLSTSTSTSTIEKQINPNHEKLLAKIGIHHLRSRVPPSRQRHQGAEVIRPKAGGNFALITDRPLPATAFFHGLQWQKITIIRTPRHNRADHSTYSHFLTTEQTQPVVSRWKNSPSLTVGRSGRPL